MRRRQTARGAVIVLAAVLVAAGLVPVVGVHVAATAVGRGLAAGERLLVALVATELVLALGALAPALAAGAPLADGLGLVRPRLSGLTTGALVLGTLVVPLPVEVALRGWQSPPSAWVAELERGLLAPSGTGAMGVLLCASVLRALCEELFFRGYLQRRLCAAWPPLVAVLFTSIAFAAVQYDAKRIATTAPLALWLGWLVWRSGSLWPALCAHGLDEALRIALARRAGGGVDPDGELLSSVGLVSLACLAFGALRLARRDGR